MGIDDYYATGTIKVKNADGELVPFVPRTSTDNVYSEGEVSLSATISEFNTRITEAAEKGGVKVMYEEPTAENTADFANKTLIGWIPTEKFSFVFDTRKISSSSKIASIPFDMYGMSEDVEMAVDWGDGSTSIFTSADYPNEDTYKDSSSTNLLHTYSTAGIKRISISIDSSDIAEKQLKLPNIGSPPTNSPIYYFKKCVTSISTPLPKLNQTDFTHCFSSCTALTSISENLFKNNTNATNFSHCFYNCAYLNSLPSGMFDNCTNVTNFSSCFEYCSRLATISSGIFDDCINVTNFSYCFHECKSLTSIPSGLFDNCTQVTNFSNCFSGLTNNMLITAIPQDLFKYNTNVTNFNKCFYLCASISSIPSGLFDNCTQVTDFSSCFNNCASLTTIPSGLFDNNINVTTFNNCFFHCSSLISIPSGLFDNCTQVTDFNSCFGYTAIETIPSGLFDNNINAIDFYGCFEYCSSLTTIPSGLFDNNINATNFQYCFSGYDSNKYAIVRSNKITSIPEDLFKYNTNATNFSNCFMCCESLTSIPEDLFKYNTAATNFTECFRLCKLLSSIPENLFKYNTAVTTFSYCFQGSTSLNNFTIHIGSPKVSTVTNFVTSKSGTTRTVYVPTGSTTQTKFNAVASSLGLTIIGE